MDSKRPKRSCPSIYRRPSGEQSDGERLGTTVCKGPLEAAAVEKKARLENELGPVPDINLACIPAWTGEKSDKKWLGITLCKGPSEGAAVKPVVGKGRPEKCGCVHRGTPKCIKYHVREQKACLESELGPFVFEEWGFPTMGEGALEGWTVKEKKNFEMLIVKYMGLSKEFFEAAVSELPFKSKDKLLSYYYELYVSKQKRRGVSPDYFA